MTRPKNAFVLMPFRQPYDSYYKAIFKPALESAGYDVSRADDLFTPRPIMLDVHKSISEADLILCEMSERNPNVFYELGLAHAIGKPAILVSRKEEDIPFDLRHIRVVVYDYTMAGWEEKLRESIAAAAGSVTGASEVWPPPIVQHSAKAHVFKGCPLRVALSATKGSFYFQSVGVKRELIATIFVVWVELVNDSDSAVTVLEALCLCRDKRIPNCAKPSGLPYSNVTYPRRTLDNDAGEYLELDRINAEFGFRPFIEDVNLTLNGGTSHSGSMIFWLIPPDTSLTGEIECTIHLRTSRGDTELRVRLPQRGV